jgi:hypothetical protein
MPEVNEWYEIEFVQYSPNVERVLVGGYSCVRGGSGRVVREFLNVHTNQTDLLLLAAEDATTWDDPEVKQMVEQTLGVACVFA